MIISPSSPSAALPRISGQIISFSIEHAGETRVDVLLFRSTISTYAEGATYPFLLTAQSFRTPGDEVNGSDFISASVATSGLLLPTTSGYRASPLPVLYDAVLTSPPSGDGGQKPRPQMERTPLWARGPRN